MVFHFLFLAKGQKQKVLGATPRTFFQLCWKKEQRGCTAEHFFPAKRLKKS
jgi:hypothetical protein